MKKIFCDMEKCTGCEFCVLACALQHSESGELSSAMAENPKPKGRIAMEQGRRGIIAFQCRHCDEAPCVYVCAPKAMYKDPETGATLCNEDKCTGCWMCVMACPFDAVWPDYERKVVFKCDLCKGREGGPACVEACPTGALYFCEAEEFEEVASKKGVSGYSRLVNRRIRRKCAPMKVKK